MIHKSSNKISDLSSILRTIYYAITRPIWYNPSYNSLKVITDTNSTLLAYNYQQYTPGGTGWYNPELTSGYALQRASWNLNIRSNIS